MNDQDHQHIIEHGAAFYREFEANDYSEAERQRHGERLISKLYDPFDGRGMIFQDKPDSTPEPVIWELVADMFWQGFYAAQTDASQFEDYEDEL